MRICFIGNSHAGPVAVRSRAILPQLGHEFHAAIERGTGTIPLKMQKGDLSCTLNDILLQDKSDAGDPVRIEDFDAIAVVGMRFGIASLGVFLSQARPDTDPRVTHLPLLSEQVYRTAINGYFDSLNCSRVIGCLQELGAENVSLLPQPNPMAWVLEREGKKYERWVEMVDAGLAPWIAEEFDAQCRRFEERGVRVVRQNASTVSDGIFTRSEFTIAKDEPGNAYFERGDYWHATTDYWETALKDYLTMLEDQQA